MHDGRGFGKLFASLSVTNDFHIISIISVVLGCSWFKLVPELQNGLHEDYFK